MIAVAALLALLPCQDEDPIREAWPKLLEAWRAMDQFKSPPSDMLDDDFLRLMGKLHDAFEAAGLLKDKLDYESAAVKRLFKLRAPRLKTIGASTDYEEVLRLLRAREGAGAEPETPTHELAGLVDAVRKLRNLREKGVDDEDNLSDAEAEVRKSLKSLKLMTDETPLGLRRRVTRLSTALVLGDGFPEAAKPTDEQAARIQKWIDELGSANLETRENATQELFNAGEAARSPLREALKSGDPEVVERVRRVLGVGHRPWETSRKPDGGEPNAAAGSRPFLGITGLDYGDGGGVEINSVVDGAAAERAGLEQGDIILEFDGKKVGAMSDLYGAIRKRSPGEKVTIKIRRGVEEREIEGTLGSR